MGYVSEKIRRQTRALVITGQARERLRKLQAANPEKYSETLMDLIPRATPKFERPEPLAPLVHMLERSATERVFGVGATPPQHGKTFCILTFLAWITMKTPGKQHAYVTYSQDRARSISTKAERIFDSIGIRRTGTLDQWRLPDYDTTIFWTSVGGKLTGEGIDGALVVDDPYKDRQEACSPAYQRRAMDWYEDVADTRLNPGSSMFVVATRWDQLDMSGQLLARANPIGDGDMWEQCNLKAICEGDGPEGDDREIGEALWPERKPLKELLQKQAAAQYTFASMFQGMPRPRGGSLFNEPGYYNELPRGAYRVGLGTDLAYSKKTSADWSTLTEMWRVDGMRADGLPLFYVVGVDRAQVKAPEFVLTLRNAALRHPGNSIYWYASGVEAGVGDFIIEKSVPLVVIPPPGDKYSRAIPFSEAWNEGRVLLPSTEYGEETGADIRWVTPYAYEVTTFTGINDANDDQVDSSVSAYDALQFEETDYNVTGGKSSRR